MNRQFVLDASVALSWVFPGETSPPTNSILERLQRARALAPASWPFEVINALHGAERRGRITLAQQVEFVQQVQGLPVEIECWPLTWLSQRLLPLGRQYGLTAYDAAYLELAIREKLPLATLDQKLREAARAAGVPLVELPA